LISQPASGSMATAIVAAGCGKHHTPPATPGAAASRGSVANQTHPGCSEFPAPGLGGSQAQERAQWLIDSLARPVTLPFAAGAVCRTCAEAALECDRALELVREHVAATEAHAAAGLMQSVPAAVQRMWMHQFQSVHLLAAGLPQATVQPRFIPREKCHSGGVPQSIGASPELPNLASFVASHDQVGSRATAVIAQGEAACVRAGVLATARGKDLARAVSQGRVWHGG
jgi:hypothetical protein